MKTTEWTQVSGDVNASDYGATFARWERDFYTIVQVTYLPDCSSEFDGDPLPYYVSEYEFSAEDLHDDEMERAIRSWGMPDDYEWTDELKFLCLFEYGKQDPRQPSTYFDEYGSQMPTLKCVMDDYAIPATALWRSAEYESIPA